MLYSSNNKSVYYY